jgi:signal transduction histidine kinase
MTARWLRPSVWPITLSVPALVAGLTVAVAVVISNVALQRLAADQEANLRQLAESYLDGLSTALLPHVFRRDVWETFDVLDLARERYTGVRARYTLVALPDGSILAASDPRRFAIGARVPDDIAARVAVPVGLVIDVDRRLAWTSRDLVQDGKLLGRIIAEIDIGSLLDARRQLLITLVSVNGALTLLFGAGGYFAARRMVNPLTLLTRHVEGIRDGSVEPIPGSRLGHQGSEFNRLFASFNAMAAALKEREALAERLTREEKIVLLGKLASGIAHEVNNPIGGMLNLVDTLRKHGDDPAVRNRALDLLERGLKGIANITRAALTTYKTPSRPLALSGPDIDDLRFLLQHELHRRQLRLDWNNRLGGSVTVDAAAVRQVALNLLLNACVASPAGGEVRLDAAFGGRELVLQVHDLGPGLPDAVAMFYRHPETAPRAPDEQIGLGTWTICQLVARLGGRIEVDTAPGRGSLITVTIPARQGDELDAVA